MIRPALPAATKQLALYLVGGLCAVCLCQNAPSINAQRVPFNPQRAPFDPEHQRPVALETDTMSAEVISNTPDPVTGSSKLIRLRFSGKAKEVVVHLPFEFAQVNTIEQGSAGKLIIIGMRAGDDYEIGILDTNTSQLIDHFTCFDPSISPNGQYIAFTKSYPLHGIESAADHSMLYVVARSPKENRPEGTSLSEYENVGFEVYPPGMGNWDRDNVDVASAADYHLAGGYLWIGNEQYVFASGVSGQLSLIWVSIANGSASIRAASVPKAEEVMSSTPIVHLEKMDLTTDGFVTTFSNPMLNGVFPPKDFTSSGSVDLTALPVGKP